MKIFSSADTVELYWDDLSEKAQASLLNVWGNNRNFDTLPLAILPIHPLDAEDDDEDDEYDDDQIYDSSY